MNHLLLRKLFLLGLLYLVGVFFYKYSLFIFAFSLIASLILSLKNKKYLILLLASFFILFGGIYTGVCDKIAYQKALPLLNGETQYTAKVISVPEIESYGMSATIECDGIKLRLMTNDERLSYGDIVSFSGTAKLPDTNSRSGDFNYRTYLKSKGIHLTVFSSEIDVLRNDVSPFNIVDIATKLKIVLLDKTKKLFSGEPLMFIRAILLGETSLSTSEFREKLSNGSISHIIAVSGLHVSLVAGLILYALNGISYRRRWIKLMAIPLIFFFALLTGASPSSIRAATMLSLFVIADAYYFHYDSLTSLAVASFLIVLFNPFAAFSLSFILSFSAVLGIVTFAKRIGKVIPLKSRYFNGLISVTLSAQVFTFPILAISFGKIPLFSLLSNVIAVPLVPVIMGLGYIALIISFIFFPLSEFLAKIVSALIVFILRVASFLGGFSFSNLSVYYPNVVIFIIISILVIAIFYAIFIYKNKLATFIISNLTLLAILVAFILPLFSPSKTIFMNAYKGDATLAISKTSSVLVELTSEDENFTKDSLIPYLKRNYISSLDGVALTEYNKYDENLKYLIENFKVKHLIVPQIFSGSSLEEIAKERGTLVLYLKDGDTFKVGNINLEIAFSTDKNLSYILENDGVSTFIAGNVKSVNDKAIAREAVPCDIYKTMRHGTKSNSMADILSAICPRAIIVSADRKVSDAFINSIGTVPYFNTRESGDICAQMKNGEIVISPYKEW